MIVLATVFFIGLAWVMRCAEVDEVYGIATRREVAGKTVTRNK
jgi:hypothetical protein